MAQTTLAFVCQKGTPLSDTFWLTMSPSLLKKAQNTQNLYPHKKDRTNGLLTQYCLRAALESGAFLYHFRATYSQKPLPLKLAQSK
jgi:hypothetical protein